MNTINKMTNNVIQLPHENEWGACFPLHFAAFHNDVKSMAGLLRNGHDIQQQDMHGNTALHLAVMLGFKESISLLLAHDAPVKVKNSQGWNPLMEAISYGDRQTIASLLRKLKTQSRDAINSRKPHLLRVLNEIDDFYLELKWDFHSWHKRIISHCHIYPVPLLSRVLPSDICKVYKKGTQLRFDTTLVDFSERTWQRGDISFVFDADADDENQRLLVMDNVARVFQRVKYQESELELDEEVDVLMSSDMVNVHMSTKTINFDRSVSGWFFKHERTEKVGVYNAQFYTVDGLYVDTRKRREHLTHEDIKKNKAIVQNFQMGNLTEEDIAVCTDLQLPPNRNTRRSLPPPAKPGISFDVYCSADSAPCLGRPQHNKRSSKHFKATVAVSTEFPFTLQALLDILEVIAPFKHIAKLRRFCELRMPPGFPVRLELPLFPTISAKVTFQKLQFVPDLSSSMFFPPSDYTEDSTRFPDL